MARSRTVSSRILDRYVLTDERVVVATRHHWAKLIAPVALVVVAFFLIALVSNPVEHAFGSAALLMWWIWFASLAWLVWRVLEWRNEWFVATDKRLLKTYGLIYHKVAMMPLRKVTDLNYSRSPVGRILGYGQFLLESAGQDQAMRQIDWLPDPDNVYRRICETIFGPGGHDPDEDGPDPAPPRRHLDIEVVNPDTGEPRTAPPASPAPRPTPVPAPSYAAPSQQAAPPASPPRTGRRSALLPRPATGPRPTAAESWARARAVAAELDGVWEVSTEDVTGRTPVDPARRVIAEDPDITGPVPPPRRG